MATVSPVTSEEPEVISTSYTYVMCTILALTAMAAFLGNLMVIAVIIRSSKLHTITWCLLLNLASSDFLSAALLVPMVISIQPSEGGMPQPWLCTLIGFTYTVLAEASVWTLALLSIERYFAVNQPLHYHQRVTRHRAIVAVCSLWICALCWGSVPFVLPGYSFHRKFRMCLPMLDVAATLAFIGIGICLPFVILCCMYISIGRTAFTQAQRKVIECNEDNCRYVSPKHKDYRAVKILALLAGVFATCWLPLNILTVVDLFKSVNLQFSLCQISLALTLMNAAINPWLYSILNRTFRTAACKQYKHIRDSIRVFCYCDDNKVRPPSDMELKCGNFGRQMDQMSQSQIKQEDLETKRVPLLPNQVSEPQITVSTSSQMQKSLSTPVTRNKTI